MPDCRKCNSKFATRTRIGKKIVNAQRRKYCFKCSPYKSHNTKRLEVNRAVEVSCKCGRVYTYNKKKGHTLHECNSCVVRKHKIDKKAKCIKYKGGQCSACGYKKSTWALSFHHVDRKTKSIEISRILQRSWPTIKKELDKCILVCANCHFEEEERLVGLWRSG